LISLAGYKIYNLGYAEYSYALALKDIKENKAKSAYDNLKKAINLNKDVDRYHKTLSSINLAVANSLKDNEQAPVFVQESINEAKAAVAVNNKRSENWEILGKTYKILAPFAEGADKFAIDSYKEAINLDPINPNLRISLGEIYMLKKDYKTAIEIFTLAVLAKDDHPNAHFNLSLAYKENGDIKNARLELEKTISFLDVGSEDYQKAMVELEKLLVND
jgi:tetratricopeptide (TPR) repeat protein